MALLAASFTKELARHLSTVQKLRQKTKAEQGNGAEINLMPSPRQLISVYLNLGRIRVYTDSYRKLKEEARCIQFERYLWATK